MRRQAAEANAAKEQRLQSQRNAGVPTMNARASGDGDAANAGKRARAKTEVGGDEKKREPLPKPDYAVACPRCKSDDTKFCYYNNYNIKQPRFYCKKCCRYWTEGGSLRNVRVGAGRRKKNSLKDVRGRFAVAQGNDDQHVGGKRARCTPATPAEKGSNRNRSKTARTKRDGSSDGSATEAEQGEGMNSGYGGRQPSGWNTNGSNAGSDTALRDRSPTDEQGSAEGSQQAPVGDTAAMGYNVSGWGIDPTAARYVNAGMSSTSDKHAQAQAAAAAAASAAIMSAASRWGMQFWNKSMFPFGGMQNSASLPQPALSGAHVAPATPISEAALKTDCLSHPTPSYPTAATAATTTYAPAARAPGSGNVMSAMQYSSLFQNPWAQFTDQQDHSNPAVFQAIQQQMFNQQMAAHFIQMQQFQGAMQNPYGFGSVAPAANTSVTATTSAKIKAIKTENETSEQKGKTEK